MVIVQELEKGFVLQCDKCDCTFLFEERNFTQIHILENTSGGYRREPSTYSVPCPSCQEKVGIEFRNFSINFYYTNLDHQKPTIETR